MLQSNNGCPGLFLPRFFAEDLVAKRFRCVVTSRPISISKGRFMNSFKIYDLLRLTTEQVKVALNTQLRQMDAFFSHLFAVRDLRDGADHLCLCLVGRCRRYLHGRCP